MTCPFALREQKRRAAREVLAGVRETPLASSGAKCQLTERGRKLLTNITHQQKEFR